MNSAAVISRVGGVTCHAAIVCRESQVPCLVQCSDAFDLFEEGQKIQIDTKSLSYQIMD
jgi:phosphohistidine swiveling domain-containing protein